MAIQKIILIAILLLCDLNMEAQQFQLKDLDGCWKVKDHLHDDESAYSKQRLNAYSKMDICFDKDSVLIFSDILIHPRYSFEKVNALEYVSENYQVDKNYFLLTADTLINITIDGTLISKKYHKQFLSEYNFFYDGNYLFLFQDMTTFRLYKPRETGERNTRNKLGK